MDAFEKYLNEHRAELERVEEPQLELIWKEIQSGLGKTARKNGWSLHIGAYWKWSIAAGIAILVILGIGFFRDKPQSTVSFADWLENYPALVNQEKQYQKLVAETEARLQIDTINRLEFRDIFEEILILEQVRLQMQKDLPATLSEEDILHTLMKYYERKIRILERLSRELEKRKRDEKKQFDPLI